ncbi:MAG: plasmid pRiA4b ORF-3 family protein [Verrucomicrobia bacterium]|nr:MAG: plasmid pRiA4b ORF-3 family protein [Verrucomicrobiota bacterium]
MIKAITRHPGGYQLRVQLADIDPAIWRLFTVPAGITLGDLHKILQLVMGWEDSHLHQFRDRKQCYGIPDEDDDFDTNLLDEESITIDEFFTKRGSKLIYEYDFGDGWEHLIVCQKILAETPAVAVVDGARACPPEDCGGVGGYYDLLEVLADSKHERYAELKEWLGVEYDPEHFDAAEINKVFEPREKRK